MKTLQLHLLLSTFFLIAVFQLSSLKSQGQDMLYYKNITLETNASYVQIDTSQADNIWQIGTPSKVYFDSAYSTPFAVVTDTMNYYPPKNHSWFDIKIIPPPNSCWGMGYMAFTHKYDTRPCIDGCWLDVRYDNDSTWTNLILDEDPEYGVDAQGYYSPGDTIANGTPAFSGTSDGWTYSVVYWTWQIGVKYPLHDSLTIRFNFMSGDGETAREGWMVDDISLYLLDCTGGIDDDENLDPEVSIVPNPVKNVSVMRFKTAPEHNYLVSIYNMYGQLVKQIEGKQDLPVFIHQRDFAAGNYVYKIVENERVVHTGKFVVSE